jgi:imidazolonepropionase-like amidohydrolase
MNYMLVFMLAVGLGLSVCRSSGAQTETPLERGEVSRDYTILSASDLSLGSVNTKMLPNRVEELKATINLRGQIWSIEEHTQLSQAGAIEAFTRTGTSPNGDAHEVFARKQGHAEWQSPIDHGQTVAGPLDFYLASRIYPSSVVDGTESAVLRYLVRHPAESLPLLPSGQVHLRRLQSTTVGLKPDSKHVTLWQILGMTSPPGTLWLDDEGSVFASFDDLHIIRKGYENAAASLFRMQHTVLDADSAQLAHELQMQPRGPIVFHDVEVFADGKQWLFHQTVVVRGNRITEIGPTGSIVIPAGATLFDGRGKTLVPGLWDSHFHVMNDTMAASELGIGVTSVRDPGNYNDLTIDRRRRAALGDLLTPQVYPSFLLDGRSSYSSQLGTIVTSQQQAIEAVDKAKSEGFVAIKIYGSFNQAWVAATTAEAHRLGLHVHGHLPAGMRTSQAIDAGYDEITHIYFIAMEDMPQDVVDHSNTAARFLGVGQYFKDINLDKPPMSSLIELMARRQVYVDPTLVVADSVFVPSNGDLSSEYEPYLNILPAEDARNARQGGFEPPAGVTRADFRTSFRKLIELVGKLHAAGVPVVAGTDDTGLELIRELEFYVQAGFTNAAALDAATIVPARLVGAESRTGSIAVGKDADLLLVQGDPSRNIGDLRHAEVVVKSGKLINPQKVLEACGFNVKPQPLIH